MATLKEPSISGGSRIPPEGGVNHKGRRQPIIQPKFAENYMEMKKI